MSEADPPTASSPKTSPVSPSNSEPPSQFADGLNLKTTHSPPPNIELKENKTESPSFSPPPPESSPPSPPPPANAPSPPPPDAPPPSPPPASPAPPPSSPPPPPSSPPPPPPSPSPPPSSPPPPTSHPPPPPPPVFSPPPPIISPSPPAPPLANNTPVSPPAGNISNKGSPQSEAAPKSSPSPDINGIMIAGIAIGVVVIVVLCIIIACLLCLRKRKNPLQQAPQYYMDPNSRASLKVGEQQYYNNDPSQWNSPRPIPQNVQLPPPLGFMGTPMGGWGALPMATPGSSDFSSGHSGQHQTPPSPNMGGMSQFSYEELAAATNGFSQANLIGQGGFGYVHKGILPDRKVVACKSLKSGSGQGDREFRAEVEIISRVHHRHLVSLVGYCITNEQRILVYEFVPNKTMEFHLHGKGQPVLEWAIRLRIAVGSAKGLAYLHEDCMPRIIHRDIKAANILLDNNFEAMVSDFGLAKLSSDNFTHVSTRVMGTFGYLAPEYASSGKLTEKSDVFSFGVMLLELITGRRPVDTTNRYMEDSLVDWARPILSKAMEDGNYEQLVDPRLEGNYVHHEMARMVACAAASIRHSARRRPKMSQIVRALEGDSSLDDLSEGVKPGQSTVYNPNGGTDVYDTRAYNADMLKFKQMVMSSTEFNSSEYGATSEYGHPSSSSDDSRDIDRKASLDINNKS